MVVDVGCVVVTTVVLLVSVGGVVWTAVGFTVVVTPGTVVAAGLVIFTVGLLPPVGLGEVVTTFAVEGLAGVACAFGRVEEEMVVTAAVVFTATVVL